MSYRRNASSIAAEAALDGLYVARTSLPESKLDAPDTVRAYKRLGVELPRFVDGSSLGTQSADWQLLSKMPRPGLVT